MKAINNGKVSIKLVMNGKPSEIKPGECVDMDEKTFAVLSKMFELESAKEEVVIESDPQPIEAKKRGRKNGTNKKSK